ncbi:MAG TPA: hypothetical protein VK171_06065, partial [Fimbriimonas sp.]|nr:hypothetical protein [Fimbriimonas sp.]
VIIRAIQTFIAVLYLGGGIVASLVLKAPMYGLLFTGVAAAVHCGFLFAENQWVLSVSKTVCYWRAGVTGFVIAILLPYFLNLGITGWLFLALFAVDLVTVILLGNAADEVYFSDM